MSEKYLQAFNQLFSKGRMASTYKPVFLRSLLDIGDLIKEDNHCIVGREWLELKNDKLYVDLNFIAVRFAKYYWDMEYSFHLRQSQDPSDANITRFIKKYHDPNKKPPTIKELSEDRMEDFRKVVITKSLKPEVMVHIRTDMTELFKKIDSNTILFDKEIVEFLYTHKIALRKGLNHMIATYLEKLNKMTPQIGNKVDNENEVKRPKLNKEIELKLQREQDSKCFYCKNNFKRPHVDHVIPFNYVFSTEPYNCVIACQQCNCQKSDMLPERAYFEQVLDRNRDIIKYITSKNSTYTEKAYSLLFESCANEYNGTVFFKPRF